VARGVEERKVVTVLFCDLVGFTAASDNADPEEVRARIRPYHQLLKTEIERYGGTVEKFIGDAVMAIFGAPVAHEDDAERAIRAGLRILEAIAELDESDPTLALQVRIGINTGEAVVALGAKPAEGEGIVTGDVVNTASRLQGVAPVGGIAVGELTHQATSDIFDYEELEPVELKGKSSPVAIWRPTAARSRFGVDVTRAHTTPFVGRDVDLALLKATFDKSLRESSVQLITIVGEPGAGKSRIVAELQRFVDDRPELVNWRQGRCLPYGDGITFWALGEIVKAQAGILESDGQEVASDKLEQAIPADDPDREWLRVRLGSLIGLGGDQGTEREELFTAWRRFLESMASQRPVVMVFEDLHWADEPMLAFLEHLAEWSKGVPMLLVGTARPELYERHQNWAAGIRVAGTVNLSPLSEEETSRLIAGMLNQALLPAEIHGLIIERAGGNPLYAEEFVRMLRDRGLLVSRGHSLELAEGAEVPMPGSVQALIAARLDTLSPNRKRLLQDASVVGKVFWTGALERMSGMDRREITEALHELGRKELVRPERRSSMEGDDEYAFWHALVRDVCYSQIPRAQRADKHVAVAEWIEERAKDRVDDHVELLAHHYVQAMSYAPSTQGEETALRVRGRAALLAAGERALMFDPPSAPGYLEPALAMTPEHHVDRPRILMKLVKTPVFDTLEDKLAICEEVGALLRELGDPSGLTEALIVEASLLRDLGRTRLGRERLDEARDALGDAPPSGMLARLLQNIAWDRAISGEAEDAAEYAEKAIHCAEQLADDIELSRALLVRGVIRCELDDPRGLDDFHALVERDRQFGFVANQATDLENLAEATWVGEGVAVAERTYEQAVDVAMRRGLRDTAGSVAASHLRLAYDAGAWDSLLTRVNDWRTEWGVRGDRYWSVALEGLCCLVATLRGGEAEVRDRVLDNQHHAVEIGDPQVLVPAFAAAGEGALARGDVQAVRDVVAGFEHATGRGSRWYRGIGLAPFVRLAIGVGDIDVATRLCEQAPTQFLRHRSALRSARAAIAERSGETVNAAALYGEAVAGWVEHGSVVEEAFARLGLGRCLLAAARPAEATEEFRRARGIFASLGAAPALAEADDLLARATAKTS
jgi:class 3 adenylate cyclase